MTTLSLCMICRDNADTIRPCLESIRPWVDEMVVVDTGSKDATPEIVQEFGARLFHFEWCDDFAAARNESLRHARGDWLFWMDTDDTIDIQNGEKLRCLAQGLHSPTTLGYVMQVHCPGATDGELTVVDHVKLIRNHPELRFEFRIHEQVLPSIRRLAGGVEWTDIFVIHSGSDQSPEGRLGKCQRDLRILELELSERPDHPFVWFNLGMTYADMDDRVRAISYLQHCIEISTLDESHLRKAYALLVASLSQVRDEGHARRVCREGLDLYPDDPELLFLEGRLAHAAGLLDEAEQAYLKILTSSTSDRFSSVDPGISSYKARHNLGLVYVDMGRSDLAEVQWRNAVGETRSFEPSRHALVETLVHQHRVISASIATAIATLY